MPLGSESNESMPGCTAHELLRTHEGYLNHRVPLWFLCDGMITREGHLWVEKDH